MPAVTYGGKKLVKNTDYTVSYSKNTAIGQASVKITGKGLYKGTKTVNFNIRPATVTKLKVSSTGEKSVKLSWKRLQVLTATLYTDMTTQARNGIE